MITFLQLLRDPMNQINGFKFIHDFSGTSIHHLKYCTPQAVHLLYHSSLYCIPGRYKEMHLLYDSIALKTLWAIARFMVSEKIKQRVFIHSSPEELNDYFSRSVLPAEYGGEIEDIYSEDFARKANKANTECTVAGQANFY
ncbi:alpha-tocopherol transfer protein-like [Caerostris darwini]|uniref:Alpha-tocopherol transfer protein-like n=1 Tax=Caerostris darwini TaxID=1538125 RepID=A0AAV4U2H3_9ARAC|nr:alpha-tocopherol transfer protein-like [Caerostris darwini]